MSQETEGPLWFRKGVGALMTYIPTDSLSVFLRLILTVCDMWQTVSIGLLCLMPHLCALFLGNGIIPG